jgi:hypothetical protein
MAQPVKLTKQQAFDKLLIKDIDLQKPTISQAREMVKNCLSINDGTGFLYFLMNFVKFPHPSRGEISLSESLYDWQCNTAQDMFFHNFFITKKSRQTASSSFFSSYTLYRSIFYENQTSVCISIGQRESTEFLDRIKFQYERLPMWLRAENKEFQKTAITFKNGSKIRSLPTGPNIARGLSGSLIILDEFAFTDSSLASKILASAIPALGMSLKTPYTSKTAPGQLAIISTLPEVSAGNEYMRILDEARSNNKSNFFIVNVTTDDIKEYNDENWHRQMLEAMGERKYKTEILGQENIGFEEAFIPSHILNAMKPSPVLRTDYLYSEKVNIYGEPKDLNELLYDTKDQLDIDKGYIRDLWIFKDVVPSKEYGITCDLSSGRANDYSSIQVFDLETYEQVAEYKSKIDLERFKIIIELITNYYNKAKLSVENTGLGTAIAEYFASTVQYENLYFHQINKNKIVPGFPNSTKTRPQALAAMQNMLCDPNEAIKINSIRTINELRNFGHTSTGIKAMQGSDDLTLALAQFCFLTQNGFFATDKMIVNNLIYGEMLEEQEKKEAEIKSMHFLNKRNDIVIEDESQKFLDVMNSLGFAMSKEELDKVLKNQ